MIDATTFHDVILGGFMSFDFMMKGLISTKTGIFTMVTGDFESFVFHWIGPEKKRRSWFWIDYWCTFPETHDSLLRRQLCRSIRS